MPHWLPVSQQQQQQEKLWATLQSQILLLSYYHLSSLSYSRGPFVDDALRTSGPFGPSRCRASFSARSSRFAPNFFPPNTSAVCTLLAGQRKSAGNDRKHRLFQRDMYRPWWPPPPILKNNLGSLLLPRLRWAVVLQRPPPSHSRKTRPRRCPRPNLSQIGPRQRPQPRRKHPAPRCATCRAPFSAPSRPPRSLPSRLRRGDLCRRERPRKRQSFSLQVSRNLAKGRQRLPDDRFSPIDLNRTTFLRFF